MNGKEEVGMNNIPSFFFFMEYIQKGREERSKQRNLSLTK
jgi:hypothetical protein